MGDNDREGGGDENHPDNKKLTGENWTSLREKKRGCTDCMCVVSEGVSEWMVSLNLG